MQLVCLYAENVVYRYSSNSKDVATSSVPACKERRSMPSTLRESAHQPPSPRYLPTPEPFNSRLPMYRQGTPAANVSYLHHLTHFCELSKMSLSPPAEPRGYPLLSNGSARQGRRALLLPSGPGFLPKVKNFGNCYKEHAFYCQSDE